jgi:hypothetical protein
MPQVPKVEQPKDTLPSIIKPASAEPIPQNHQYENPTVQIIQQGIGKYLNYNHEEAIKDFQKGLTLAQQYPDKRYTPQAIQGMIEKATLEIDMAKKKGLRFTPTDSPQQKPEKKNPPTVEDRQSQAAAEQEILDMPTGQVGQQKQVMSGPINRSANPETLVEQGLRLYRKTNMVYDTDRMGQALEYWEQAKQMGSKDPNLDKYIERAKNAIKNTNQLKSKK